MGIKVQKEIRKRSREIILSSNPGRTDTQEALTPVKKHIQPFYTIAGRIRPRVCTCNNAKNNNFIVEIVFYGLICPKIVCVFKGHFSI